MVTTKTDVVYWKNSKEKWVKEERDNCLALKTHSDLSRRPLIVADRSRHKRGQGRRVESPKDYANNLTSVQKDNYLFENLRVRKLTPTECERLQGFPDGWTEGVSDTQRYKCLGNAVTVNVIEFLGYKIRESLYDSSI